MKKIAMACALLLTSPAFAADTAAQLVQACQSLKRQEDRNVCLVAAVKAVAPQPVTAAPMPSAKEAAQARIAKALEASQTIHSVGASGTSYLQYQSYIPPFAIALDQFKAAAQSQEEKDAAVLLSDALDAYSDAGTYWQLHNRFYAYENNRIGFPDAMPAALAGTTAILLRYNVPVQRADMFGLQKGASLETALTTIWQYAQDKTNAAKDAIANLGIPARVDQKTADSAPTARSDAPAPVLREMIGKPLIWHVRDDYNGGAYVDHELSAPRDHEEMAGKPVPMYATYGQWIRATPTGEAPKWFRMADLHAATDVR